MKYVEGRRKIPRGMSKFDVVERLLRYYLKYPTDECIPHGMDNRHPDNYLRIASNGGSVLAHRWMVNVREY